MKVKLETIKGKYESESLRDCREWLETHEPAFSTILVWSRTEVWERANFRHDLPVAEALIDALAQIVLDVYDSGEYEGDNEMPHRLCFHQIAARLEQTVEESDPDDIETAIRFAGHDLHREC
jgi:hypothetical protein